MALFDRACPMCQSVEWRSVKRDENAINEEIQCIQCGTIRTRRQEPIETSMKGRDPVRSNQGKCYVENEDFVWLIQPYRQEKSS